MNENHKIKGPNEVAGQAEEPAEYAGGGGEPLCGGGDARQECAGPAAEERERRVGGGQGAAGRGVGGQE